MSEYYKLKEKYQNEVNAFPMFFAFDNNQFAEGMKKLGLEVTDTDKIYSISEGGYIRRTDNDALADLINRNEAAMNKAIAEDKTGLGFIYDMFKYELDNHEYGYTYDVEETLNALNLTYDDVINDPHLSVGLKKAMEEIESREAI